MVTLRTLLRLLPKDLVDGLAAEYDLDETQQVKLPGPAVFACLMHALLHHPLVTQRLLESVYRRRTKKGADHSAFSLWLARVPPEFMAGIFAHVYEQVRLTMPPHALARLPLRRVDATVVRLSAKLVQFGLRTRVGNQHTSQEVRQLKAVFELGEQGLARLLRVCKEQRELNDCEALGEAMEEHVQPGVLFIFDRGCNARRRLWALHQQGAYWLTRHNEQTWRVVRTLFLACPQPSCGLRLEQAQQGAAGPPGPGEPDYRLLRAELVILANSKPDSALSDMPVIVLTGERYNTRSKRWEPLVLLTNLPLNVSAPAAAALTGGPDLSELQDILAGPYTLLEVAELYRLRWEIETFFRLLKEHLGYEHLLSRTENGIQTMIYAALTAALLLQWHRQVTGNRLGWRAVKYELSEDAREWLLELLQQSADACCGAGPPG